MTSCTRLNDKAVVSADDDEMMSEDWREREKESPTLGKSPSLLLRDFAVV